MGGGISNPATTLGTELALATLSGLSYTIRNLVGPPGSSLPMAFGINEAGAVAGQAHVGDQNGTWGGDTGVIWTHGVVSHVIGPTSYVLIYGGLSGLDFTIPVHGSALRALNRQGVAVGWRYPGQENVVNAAIQFDGTKISNIPIPESWSHALDINDAGTICGADWTNRAAFVYDRSTGALRSTGLPGAEYAVASAINEIGEVVGSSDGQAFFDSGGAVISLGPAGARDVNDAGIVVGSKTRTDGRNVPARCDARSSAPAWTEIPLPPGFIGGAAHALNRSGHVVGSCHAGGGGRECAFINIDGASYDLNLLIDAPGWHLQTAQDINDRGLICGNGTFMGQPAAWLLAPPLVLPELPPIDRKWPLKPTFGDDGEAARQDASILLRVNQAATSLADPALRERVRTALAEARREADEG